MLRKLLAYSIVAVSIATASHADNLKGDKAVLRALDKVTATTQDFTVPVGDTLNYGSLEITVRHCEKKPPEETPEVFVFLQVFEPGKEAEESEQVAEISDEAEIEPVGFEDPEKLFSGWMFASSPALSSLEHPVYDIWVLDCAVPAGRTDLR